MTLSVCGISILLHIWESRLFLRWTGFRDGAETRDGYDQVIDHIPWFPLEETHHNQHGGNYGGKEEKVRNPNPYLFRPPDMIDDVQQTKDRNCGSQNRNNE